MGRPRQVTDNEILDAARQCFLEHGPGVSTTVIAGRIGVSEATVFKRFGTKQGLMLAALTPPAHPEWIDVLKDGPDQRPVPAQLREVAERYDRFMSRIFPALMVLRASGHGPEECWKKGNDSPPVRGVKAMTGWFARLRGEGRVGDVDPEVLAMTFLGALHMRLFLSHMTGGKTPRPVHDEFLERFIGLLWTGAAPKGEAR